MRGAGSGAWDGAEGWCCYQNTEQVSPLGVSVGRKMKQLESQLEKQQQDLSEGGGRGEREGKGGEGEREGGGEGER